MNDQNSAFARDLKERLHLACEQADAVFRAVHQWWSHMSQMTTAVFAGSRPRATATVPIGRYL